MHWDANKIFQILRFYNTFIERPEVKKLNNVELLKELPFYDKLSIVKNKTAFSGYAQSYNVEIVDKRGVVIQLKASELSIKELFKDLLTELKGFKYQITLAVLLSKVKNNGEIEYSPVYFNSLTKTVKNNSYKLNQSYQYLSISSYLPLNGSTYIKLPVELRHPMKGLINIQNNDNKCFMWCHVRHLNLGGVKLQRIKKEDKEIAKGLDYEGVNFPVSKKDYGKIEVLNKTCINVFCYENKVVYPVYLSTRGFDDCLDLSLISNNFTSHYVYIKDFNRLMFNKTKHKCKKYFCKSCLQCFSSDRCYLNTKKIV